jgi:ATP phosphoribosyltransferase regulatory subunit HisZ
MRKEIATGGRYTVNSYKDSRQASGFSLDLKDIHYISTRGKNV